MNRNPAIEFVLSDRVEGVEVTPATSIGEIVPWVKVEKYLFGTIMNMGGVQKANVHLRLDDGGQVVTIRSDQANLKGNDRLYHKVLLRVEADQHYKTADLRNLRLLSFEDYEHGYNEEALDAFVAAGTQAWADVPDAAGWVRTLRGEIEV